MDLGTLGGQLSNGTGINDLGQVTGVAETPSGSFHAFLYSNGAMQDLGVLPTGTSSYGIGVNNSGQVTGYADIFISGRTVKICTYLLVNSK